jgi:hypothetical protein
MLIVAGGSTAAAIAASLWWHPLAPEQLSAFYERVRPPGVWGAVAATVDTEDHVPARALLQGLAAVVLCTVTVFGLLVGLGTWMLDATPPAWVPDRGVWIGINLTAAVAAMPLWMRIAQRRSAG